MDLTRLNKALSGWWEQYGDLVRAIYPWESCVNPVPNCLIILADGFPQFKFEVAGSKLILRDLRNPELMPAWTGLETCGQEFSDEEVCDRFDAARLDHVLVGLLPRRTLRESSKF